MSVDYDIVIIGAGLAGSTLAAALAALPYRVALIDKQPLRQHTVASYDDRSLALNINGRRILQHFNVWNDELAANLFAIKTVHVSEQAWLPSVLLHARDYQSDALGYVVPNRALGSSISHALESHPRLDTLTPESVTDVDTHIDACYLTLASGKKISTKLMIVADGSQSQLRDQLNIPVDHIQHEQTAIIANVSYQKDNEGVAYELFTRDGPTALLPLESHKSALIWVQPKEQAEFLLALDEQAFIHELHKVWGYRLGRFTHVGTRSHWPLNTHLAQNMIADRSVLIGNTAHTLHPIAGQGFNLTLRDIECLVELIQQHGLDNPILLAEYEERRLPDIQRMMNYTEQLLDVFTNTHAPYKIGRRLALTGLRQLPFIKHHIAKIGMGELPWQKA